MQHLHWIERAMYQHGTNEQLHLDELLSKTQHVLLRKGFDKGRAEAPIQV